MNNSVFDCQLVKVNTINNKSGNIAITENKNLPFNINRVYYLYDVPAYQERGGHSHYKLQQYLIAASGSFTVLLKDGKNERRIFLNKPNVALHILPGIWREMLDFSSGAICLVLASDKYSEEDYIRDYNQFLNFKK